jgi:hypothetical protein
MERISKIRSRREMFRAAIAGVTGMGAAQATAHAATQGAAKDAKRTRPHRGLRRSRMWVE